MCVCVCVCVCVRVCFFSCWRFYYDFFLYINIPRIWIWIKVPKFVVFLNLPPSLLITPPPSLQLIRFPRFFQLHRVLSIVPDIENMIIPNTDANTTPPTHTPILMICIYTTTLKSAICENSITRFNHHRSSNTYFKTLACLHYQLNFLRSNVLLLAKFSYIIKNQKLVVKEHRAVTTWHCI